jgi:thiamine-monophosphate kinase
MEAEFLGWLAGRLIGHENLPVGPGDDAAVLQFAQQNRCVVTTDLLTDGVDFRLADAAPQRIGRKALAVNLSDLAAMAARPVAVLISLALPRDGALELAKELYEGLLPLAAEFGVAIAGGDTNTWDGPLVLSVTAIGVPTEKGPLLRSGAKPGDRILVTGHFGGSILGKHFDFQPRVVEALALHSGYELHAGMDVSDGLSLDLARLAEASGCGALLDLSAIPISQDAIALCQQSAEGQSALDHALGDGEDFELLLAVPPDSAARIIAKQPLDVPLTDIGEFVAQPGLWARSGGDRLQPLAPQGYQH